MDENMQQYINNQSITLDHQIR